MSSESSRRAQVDLREAADPVTLLSNGGVLVEYGPMRMVITALDHGKPLVDLAREGGYLATRVLEDLARCLPVLKKRAQAIEIEGAFPEVVETMIGATRKMEEADLTPLAAVAGAASDVVADFLISQGGTKIIVDNGGDIAIRLREGEMVRVGVKTDILAQSPSFVLTIDSGMGIGGVATSGLGGRSFTRGIATAATVVATTASLADAAATVIGNWTNAEDPAIERSLAETIYPETDIAGAWVTTKVGNLSREKTEEAMRNGLARAKGLTQRGHIKGALVAVRGSVGWTDSMNPWMKIL
jgi:hypothetical protein